MTILSLLAIEAVLIAIAIAVLFIFTMIFALIRRYKRCPPDHILVIYGRSGQGSAKCIHGGAAFVWPVIQDFQYLDLTPISIVVDLKNALSKQNIRVNVPSRFTVAISPEPGVRENAAERLLGLTSEQIQHLASDIIFGQLRVVIATMDIEEINSDREKFLKNISAGVEHELVKIGLKLINVNITDITDESGYIEALGKAAAAQAINDAKKAVAEKSRDGSIGEANANKDQRIKVAALKSEAEIGEAEAAQRQRTAVSTANATAVEGENKAEVQIANSKAERSIGEAEAQQKQRIANSKANATAVEGENLAQITIANSNSQLREQKAEAERKALTAEKVNKAKAEQDSFNAETLAELARAEREKATQKADIIIPAEIAKQKLEIESEAEAERLRRIAKGEADALFARMQAEAQGMLEILSKQAEGFQRLVQAAGGSREAAMMMITDKLPELVKTQVEAIKNIKIDKVTVWDSGGSNGKSSTSNFMSSMLTSIPPLEELFRMAGMEIPDYLKGKKTQAEETVVEDITAEETKK